jgi:hypothetical protein
MGHSEMMLAVAGLSQQQIDARVAGLADDRWSAFTPAEQVAFRFARKLSLEPWSVSDDDVATLVATFGRARALDLIWHVAWGNYMIRVADAFQLPLEPENVFLSRKPPPRSD